MNKQMDWFSTLLFSFLPLLSLHAQHIITHARVRRVFNPSSFISPCHTRHTLSLVSHTTHDPPPSTSHCPPQRKPGRPSRSLRAVQRHTQITYTYTKRLPHQLDTDYEDGADAAAEAAGSIMSQMELAILKEDSLVQSRQNSRTSSPPGSDTTVCAVVWERMWMCG